MYIFLFQIFVKNKKCIIQEVCQRTQTCNYISVCQVALKITQHRKILILAHLWAKLVDVFKTAVSAVPVTIFDVHVTMCCLPAFNSILRKCIKSFKMRSAYINCLKAKIMCAAFTVKWWMHLPSQLYDFKFTAKKKLIDYTWIKFSWDEVY